MSDRAKVLLQLDSDAQPSTFDAVVAADAGADQLFRHGGVAVDDVTGLVHGLMFTRGPNDLHRSAVFVGGSDVATGEAILGEVEKCFFGPIRVSVMMDSNGCNTTASAAVLALSRHLEFAGATICVLGGTGPVGQRAARLLAQRGATVRLASRTMDRAADACRAIEKDLDDATVQPVVSATDADLAMVLGDAQAVIAAGAAGIQLVSTAALQAATSVRVAIDLNAVPPAGIEGIGLTDNAVAIGESEIIGYGPIGVGGLKMKIHKAAIRQLFESNDRVFDIDSIYALGESIVAAE